MQSGGDDLISIAVASPNAAQMLARRLRESASLLEVVAGIDSVVVRFDIASDDREKVQRVIRGVIDAPFDEPQASASVIEIAVNYGGDDGPDLDHVCQQLGLSQSEFIALHTARDYAVDMLGFTPGFAYVGGLDERLNVPRLAAPRVSVPAGSVGIAAGQTGLYALQGPGGWPLIGRTAFELFDPNSSEPFVLRPGSKIRFVAVNSA